MIRGLSVMIDGDILSDFLEYIFLSRFSSSTKHYMPVRVGDGIAQGMRHPLALATAGSRPPGKRMMPC